MSIEHKRSSKKGGIAFVDLLTMVQSVLDERRIRRRMLSEEVRDADLEIKSDLKRLLDQANMYSKD